MRHLPLVEFSVESGLIEDTFGGTMGRLDKKTKNGLAFQSS